ncbi:MAG: GTP-binding protein [bacterium]
MKVWSRDVGRWRHDRIRSVHLFGGLPTERVGRGVERIREVLPVQSFAEFVASPEMACEQLGVQLPPHVESSEIVEDWEACDHLAKRFGRGAGIGNVVTLVDSERVEEQLRTSDSMAAHGWGRSHRDMRTLADIVVGQIESATHLVLVGSSPCCERLRRLLGVLNPSAARLVLDNTSNEELRVVLTGPRPIGSDDRACGSARVVPPWLELLRAESPERPTAERFLYRRRRPFDARRFGEWLADPPRALLRGKGNVWLENRCDQALGYSCAGSVHRLFVAGQWWASTSGSTWPDCDGARRRLLERWHPLFGDRRQEIAFVGVDLDPEAISLTLDACLLSEEEVLRVEPSFSHGGRPGSSAPPWTGLH